MRWAPAFQLVTRPCGIEHEDRVVGDALDEDPEAPLGLEQRLLRGALLGHVAGDLGEADQLALVVVDRVDDTLAQKRVPSLRTRQPSPS